jgi:hypothetical protein
MIRQTMGCREEKGEEDVEVETTKDVVKVASDGVEEKGRMSPLGCEDAAVAVSLLSQLTEYPDYHLA